MNDMLTMTATEVRKEWSKVVDATVRSKPQFIKRTRDYMMLSDVHLITELLSVYTFTAIKEVEDDGSITLSLNEIDLVENGKTEEEAKHNLAASILEYAEDYYKDFNYWNSAPNRKVHLPYVLKALILDDVEKIGESIECQNGEI